MPLSDPRRYRDKTADWMRWFSAERKRRLAALVTPALIAEHAADPRGGDTPHSAALQEVLIALRSAPTVDKPFAYIEIPYRRYRLGRMQGRGRAPVILPDKSYDSERAAIHAVFLARLAWLGLGTDSKRQRGKGA